MKRNRILYVAIVLVVFFLPYGIAKAGGFWQVSGKFDTSGNPITATGADTAEIKGWMTFGDISRAYDVSLEEIATAFELPLEDVTADTALNKMESETFSVTSLRDWLDAIRESSP